MRKNFSPSENDFGKRIDQVLLSYLPFLTRTSAKKLLFESKILVNNERNRANYKVKEGDVISYSEEEVKNYLNSSENSVITPTKMILDIIFEDDSTIVVNKSAGIATHPVPGHRNDTLLNGLAYQFKDIKVRPVHRLDKDTSGVIIFAKSAESHVFYSSQFDVTSQNTRVKKIYYAVVKGDFRSILGRRDHITIQNFLTRSTKQKKRMIQTDSRNGQIAITDVYFVKPWSSPDFKGNYSLVKVVPRTGRTHQIRVHLSGIDFPIIGDPIYSKIKYRRLMLHAGELSIRLFDGTEKTFSAKLPKEFGKS